MDHLKKIFHLLSLSQMLLSIVLKLKQKKINQKFPRKETSNTNLAISSTLLLFQIEKTAHSL